MPNIRVKCPSCREELEIDSQYLGQEVECGSCCQVFVAKEPRSSLSLRDDEDEADELPRRRRPTRNDSDDEDDDYPRRRRVQRRPVKSSGTDAATWSLVLGILALPAACCCILVSIPLSLGAIGTGIAGLKSETGKGQAIGGIICGVLSLMLSLGSLIVGFGMNVFNNPGQFRGIGK